MRDNDDLVDSCNVRDSEKWASLKSILKEHTGFADELDLGKKGEELGIIITIANAVALNTYSTLLNF